METGLIIAVLAAALFGGGQVFVRKGVSHSGESFSAVPISIYAGAIIFGVMLLFTGEWSKIGSASWLGLAMLGAGGISHFVAGRFFVFSSIKYLGANKSIIITRTNVLFAATFGILLLNEPFTMYLAAGIVFLAVGAVLAGTSREGTTPKLQGKGVLVGLAGGFFWGISGVLLKPGIREIGSSLAATFVAYAVASVVITVVLLFQKEQRTQLIHLNRSSLIPFLITGVTMSFGQLLRFTALSTHPVSVVDPLFATTTLFTFLFSFLINRSIEVFNRKVILGMVLTIAGTYLLFQ